MPWACQFYSIPAIHILPGVFDFPYLLIFLKKLKISLAIAEFLADVYQTPGFRTLS